MPYLASTATCTFTKPMTKIRSSVFHSRFFSDVANINWLHINSVIVIYLSVCDLAQWCQATYYTSIIPSTDYHYHRTEVGQCHPKMCLAVYSSMCMLHPWHGAVLVQGFIIMESLWYELFTWWNFSWLLMIKTQSGHRKFHSCILVGCKYSGFC